MAERRQQPQQPQQPTSKIDALYSWLSYDLQRMKTELMNEMKYSSAQVGSLYNEMKSGKDESALAIAQEIRFSYKQNQTIYDGLASMLTTEVGERLNSMDEKVSSIEQVRALNEELLALVSGDFATKLDAIAAQQALLEKIDAALAEIEAKLGEGYEKFAESVSESNRQVLDAVAAIPVAEGVDYARIADEVGDKMVAVLSEVKEAQAEALKSITVDYEKVINGSAEKVVESLPYPEKVDYRRITEITENAVAAAVEKVVAALNVDSLAAAVAEKINAVPEIDYDHLANLVVEKLAANTEQHAEIVLDEDGVEQIADKVCAKINTPEAIDYERVYLAAQAAQVIPEAVDYDRIAEIVEDKLAADAPTYDLIVDNDGIEAIAQSVSDKLGATAVQEEIVVTEAVEEPIEEVVEETAEEVVETPVEEVAEEVVESAADEAVEEIVEEVVVEPVEEVRPEENIVEVRKEIAATVADFSEYQEIDNQLVDAETGLIIRLKRSFTAKICQSEEKVKGYYSDLKNELTSYKKINSNVSWHGDRFNFGRDTVAKINICGKTLCFYLALDPNDPEYKSTVYHQKDVGAQKAYESTPFMVKIKSDAAAKKALRLVGYLAEKVGTEKEEDFAAVDYVEEFKYQSTKQLFEDGFIKVTKEKKVDLDF